MNALWNLSHLSARIFFFSKFLQTPQSVKLDFWKGRKGTKRGFLKDPNTIKCTFWIIKDKDPKVPFLNILAGPISQYILKLIIS